MFIVCVKGAGNDSPESSWNCEEMDKVWASVPSSNTRHSSIGSASSIYCTWDPDDDTLQCQVGESTENTMIRLQSLMKLDSLPPTEMYFEIRYCCFSSHLSSSDLWCIPLLMSPDTIWRTPTMFCFYFNALIKMIQSPPPVGNWTAMRSVACS